MIIGTAGHIDHGKTALVQALTGVDTDRLPEEKRRGITIDLGFAPLSLDGVGTVGIVDVPGHEDFVRSMLVGATGIDLGLLVVAADEGVMPQTREHLLILELLKIPHVVMALTKSDLVDDEWLSLATGDVSPCSWLRAADPACCSVLEQNRRWDRPPAQDIIAHAVGRSASGHQRSLSPSGGSRILGEGDGNCRHRNRVEADELAVDAAVRILPEGTNSRARRIEQHGRAVDVARAGARAAVALTGLDLAAVARGSVIVSDDSWQPTAMFEAVVALESHPRTVVRTNQLRHARRRERSQEHR